MANLFYVTYHMNDDSMPNLLSTGDSVRLNLVKRVYHAATDKAEEILRGSSDVFQGVGKMPGEYSFKPIPLFLQHLLTLIPSQQRYMT